MTIDIKRLKQAREAADLTQEEIGAKLNLSQAAYSNIESGTTQHLDIKHLVGLAKILSKPMVWFLGMENGHDFSPDELELQKVYRQLSHTSKEYVLDIAKSFLEKEKAL